MWLASASSTIYLDWKACNEALDLPQPVAAYKQRFGVYPESVHVDQLYRTRANRQGCKDRGIRLSGPPLGRLAADAQPELESQMKIDPWIGTPKCTELCL